MKSPVLIPHQKELTNIQVLKTRKRVDKIMESCDFIGSEEEKQSQIDVHQSKYTNRQETKLESRPSVKTIALIDLHPEIKSTSSDNLLKHS